MMFYKNKNKKEMVRFLDGESDIFDIVTGVLQVDTSSSSSYRAGSTDIPDPLSPLLPIVHRPR